MICPHCGQENPEKAKFCNECAAHLSPTYTSSNQQTKPLAPEPERKVVAALFSDLTGYTALTERLDPEQVKEITGQVFAGVIKGSEQTPTVIIMEDLRWADTSSLLLLQFLFRLAEKHRILFINLFRPGYWQDDRKPLNQKCSLGGEKNGTWSNCKG